MQDYHSIDINVLIQMLATHTEEYTKMLFNNDRGEAFDTCEKTIFTLQAEINSRATKNDSISLSDPNINFDEKNGESTN